MLTTQDVRTISLRLFEEVKKWGLGHAGIGGKIENGSLYVKLSFSGRPRMVAEIRVSTHHATPRRVTPHQIEYTSFQSEVDCLAELRRRALLLAQ